MIIINWQTHWKRSSGWVWWINWSDMLARELQWEPQWIWLRLYSRWWWLSRVLVGLGQQWADQGGRRQSICRGHTGRSQRWTCMNCKVTLKQFWGIQEWFVFTLRLDVGMERRWWVSKRAKRIWKKCLYRWNFINRNLSPQIQSKILRWNLKFLPPNTPTQETFYGRSLNSVKCLRAVY